MCGCMVWRVYNNHLRSEIFPLRRENSKFISSVYLKELIFRYVDFCLAIYWGILNVNLKSFFSVCLMSAWNYIVVAIQTNYVLAALGTDNQRVLLKIQGYFHIWWSYADCPCRITLCSFSHRSSRMLFKESRSVHNHLTSAPWV